jgi:ectoine hydroxylase
MQFQNRYASRSQASDAILARQEPVLHLTAENRSNDRSNARPAALTKVQRERYQKDGFLLLPDLFSPTEIGALFNEMQDMRESFAHAGREEVIAEPNSGEVRSIFSVHRINRLFANLVRDPRVLNIAREILGSDVYIHQSRINYKPGFNGKEFFWHSDFETWHNEDGMPAMRAVSCSILLTDNDSNNGPLMLIPGSHQHYVVCPGETPDENYKTSLRKQETGVPDHALLRYLADMGGIKTCTGMAGTVVFFDCNTMHASNSNVTPYPRSNVFFVYNSMENQLQSPPNGLKPRPEFVATREHVEMLEAQALQLNSTH